MTTEEHKHFLKQLEAGAGAMKAYNTEPSERRITINKRTQRIRFDGETEDEVTIVIEEREAVRSEQ